MTDSFFGAIPAELIPAQPTGGDASGGPAPAFAPAPLTDNQIQEVTSYVVSWRDKIRNARIDKENIWTQCWQLYRGLEDFSDKEDWQAKIVIPKAFSSVKQATSVIRRFLLNSPTPFSMEAINKDDLVEVLRAEQETDLVKYFMDRAHYAQHFTETLECGFIMGLGIIKGWWGLESRSVTYPTVGPDPTTGAPARQLIQRDILEGRQFFKAVDPYNFYWLPGSRLNNWVGTIEEIYLPRWEVKELAERGLFGPKGPDRVKNLTSRVDPANRKQTYIRFGERTDRFSGPNDDSSIIKLIEYYGPIVLRDGMLMRNGHCIIGNDTEMLLDPTPNPLWRGKPPYIGFSPLGLPFRTEGVGLVEMVREVNRALNKLANLGVDTLLYRLMPLFEVNPEVYENPEDFETGLTPGKIFRRKTQYMNIPGIKPIQFEDISQGSMAMSAQLDRAHQEGAMVSEIQQAIPRFRGYQSATEIDAKSNNQDSFFSDMAKSIEEQLLAPMVEMTHDLMFQFIDTATDERIARILGIGARELLGMSKDELRMLIQGQYCVRATGISEQMNKAASLQNLVQLMNIVGQNPEWMQQVNKSALLRRVLDAFTPAIRDIEQVISDPATVQAEQAAAQQRELAPDVIAMLPTMIDQAVRAQASAQAQQSAIAQASAQQEQFRLEKAKIEAEIELLKAKAAQARSASAPNTN